jgi:aspartate oxidase
MCLLGRLIVESALTRVESRGAHMRTDIDTPWADSDSPYGHTVICANESVKNSVGDMPTFYVHIERKAEMEHQ